MYNVQDVTAHGMTIKNVSFYIWLQSEFHTHSHDKGTNCIHACQKRNFMSFYWEHTFVCGVHILNHVLFLQILLTLIWLRRYPTMHSLACQFGISVSCIHKIIHKYVKILHTYLVPKYIRWHSMNTWRQLAGSFPDWPTVVGVVDGTPFRISKPKGYYNFIYTLS